MKQAQEVSATPIVTNQVPYNLTNRRYHENGVLEYCQQESILLTAYTPFDRGTIFKHITVQKLAQKYNATPAQIGLHWLIQQPGVITIPMSANKNHLAANLGAVNLQISQGDLKVLDLLR
jgi:diketogulonate reductase-like aldo/keto reductase